MQLLSEAGIILKGRVAEENGAGAKPEMDGQSRFNDSNFDFERFKRLGPPIMKTRSAGSLLSGAENNRDRKPKIRCSRAYLNTCGFRDSKDSIDLPLGIDPF